MERAMPDRNTQQPPYPVLDMVLNSIADWVNNYRNSVGNRGDLDRCDPIEVAQIATDIGISPGELRTLSGKGPGSADLVAKMLLALGVDPKALVNKDPLVMRDLQRLCSTCGNKGQCAHELADGTAAGHFHEFCPNAYTLDALVAGMDKSSAH
jgi:hypothetical protein